MADPNLGCQYANILLDDKANEKLESGGEHQPLMHKINSEANHKKEQGADVVWI